MHLSPIPLKSGIDRLKKDSKQKKQKIFPHKLKSTHDILSLTLQAHHPTQLRFLRTLSLSLSLIRDAVNLIN